MMLHSGHCGRKGGGVNCLQVCDLTGGAVDSISAEADAIVISCDTNRDHSVVKDCYTNNKNITELN
jgi:hypothetical protein